MTVSGMPRLGRLRRQSDFTVFLLLKGPEEGTGHTRYARPYHGSRLKVVRSYFTYQQYVDFVCGGPTNGIK